MFHSLAGELKSISQIQDEEQLARLLPCGKKIQGCDAWEYSRNPVLQKPSSPPGMPIQRGMLQKARDNLSIKLGNGGVLAQEQFPHFRKDMGQQGKSPKRCRKNDLSCRKPALEERLRKREVCGLKRGPS